MSLRSWAERLSRGVVLRRRIPREFGGLPLYVSPEAGLRFWRFNLAKVDPMICRMAAELVKPGTSIWDIGANVGLFAFCAAVVAGPQGSVLAVEPDLWLAELLTQSANVNRSKSTHAAAVTPLAAAVCEKNGVASLHIATRGRAANHLAASHGSTQAGGARSLQSTVTVSLDFLLDYFPAPAVVKIDVEGAEVDVLRGAEKLLTTIRPTIWCEVSPDNSMAVAELLLARDYELFAAALPEEKRVSLKRASWDTLAVPSRKVQAES